MKRALILLLVTGFVAACLYAVPDARHPVGPRPPDDPLDAPSAERIETVPAVAAATPAPSEEAERTSSPADPLGNELASLLGTLRRKQQAGHSLEETLDEIGALLRKHPGLIRGIVDAVENSDRSFRNLLVHAVLRSGNRRLRATLAAAIAEAADPGEQQVRELLTATSDRIAVAIQDLPSARDRVDLIGGLSPKQVTEPRILSALYLAAESDPDALVRRASLYKLGRSGDARGRAKVLDVLANRAASHQDRSAAALALGGRATKDDWTVFVEILRRPGEPPAVKKLAANGLTQFVGRPEVDDILFTVLETADEDPAVRMESAATIALGGLRLKDQSRADWEQRAYGALVTLESQARSEGVLAWSRSQFADSFGPEFRSRLQPEADRQSSVVSPGE